ncbi:hypothetical protein E8E14_004469 [Neopestalotiopsis sp. 37M]|nr:hypothetical protein E8E14_004469 [Neopestalotiopsis sp. 37M]
MSALKSWVSIPSRSHFSLANIPFGVISTSSNSTPRPAVAIGEHALDLLAFSNAGGFSKLPQFSSHVGVFNSRTLNDFAALGRATHRDVRQYLQSVFTADGPYPDVLEKNDELRGQALVPLADVQTHLPMSIGDYTDFFAGRNHAFNVGTLFRGPANALNPNYNHLPVAYHGRASSVVASGTPLNRPWGQVIMDPAAEPKIPTFRPIRRLDIELELGLFISRPNQLGKPVRTHEAEEHIFGYVLMNDWSARDVQTWEYVPLGPFNAKNFGTSISPWVVLADALEPFRTKGLDNPVELRSYLKHDRSNAVLDINLEVSLTTPQGTATTLSRTSSKNILWSWEQMIAHHTVTGCNLRTGDLLGSGTISGTETGTYGSILEQTQAGKHPVKLNGGEERLFVQDGDTITITGAAGQVDGGLVGFGECSGQILPALDEGFWST